MIKLIYVRERKGTVAPIAFWCLLLLAKRFIKQQVENYPRRVDPWFGGFTVQPFTSVSFYYT